MLGLAELACPGLSGLFGTCVACVIQSMHVVCGPLEERITAQPCMHRVEDTQATQAHLKSGERSCSLIDVLNHCVHAVRCALEMHDNLN